MADIACAAADRATSYGESTAASIETTTATLVQIQSAYAQIVAASSDSSMLPISKDLAKAKAKMLPDNTEMGAIERLPQEIDERKLEMEEADIKDAIAAYLETEHVEQEESWVVIEASQEYQHEL